MAVAVAMRLCRPTRQESGGVGGGSGGGWRRGVNTARTNKQVHIFDLQHAPHREDLKGWPVSESKYHVLYHCLLIPVTFFFF